MEQIEKIKSSQKEAITFWIMFAIVCIPFLCYWTRITDFFSSPVSILVSFSLIASLFLFRMPDFSDKTRLEPLIGMVGFLAISGLYFRAWGCVVNCANTVLLMILLNNIELDRKHKKYLHLLIAVLLFIFLLSLEIKPLYKTYRVTALDELELNLNTFGLLTLACYFHFWLFIERSNLSQLSRELFVLFGAIAAIYFIRLSSCRSAMIAFVIFGLFWIARNWNMHSYRKWMIVFVVFAALLPFLYLRYVDFLEMLKLAGKSFATRKMVWESAWELIQTSPVLGTGTEEYMISTNATLTASAHNVFLGLWKTVGMIPMLMFAFYLCAGKNIKHVTENNRLSKKMFLASMIICAFETLLNDSNIYIFFIMLLLTENCETEEKT